MSEATGRALRCVAAVLVAVLVLSGCGSDDSLERAEALIGQLGDTSTAVTETSGDGCITRTVLDEYDFPVEITECPGDTESENTAEAVSTTDDTEPDLGAGTPTGVDPVGVGYRIARDHLISQRSCLDPGLIATDQAAADVIGDETLKDLLRQTLAISQRISDTCMTDETAWRSATRDSVDIALALAEHLAPQVNAEIDVSRRYRDIDDRDPQHLIPDALEVLDVALGPVYVAQNELPNNVRSELWFTTTHRNNTELLIGLARRDDDQRAIFATGTSIMKSAIDEAQLAQLTQTSIANLGIAGAHGLGHLGYIETDVLPVSNPGTVVVELSYFFSHRSCTNARAALFAESIRLRDTLLEGNAFTTALSSHDLLIRTSDVTNELNVIGDPAGLWHYPNRDLGVEKVATPDELANFAQRMSDDGPSRCDALLSQLPQTLAATASSSGRTVLLLLPIPPTIYGADPAWTAEFDQFRADLVSLAAASGVELLDLSTLLTDDQFRDFAHMNDKGRAVVTEQVAALLNG